MYIYFQQGDVVLIPIEYPEEFDYVHSLLYYAIVVSIPRGVAVIHDSAG